jgi:hypothetical protein
LSPKAAARRATTSASRPLKGRSEKSNPMRFLARPSSARKSGKTGPKKVHCEKMALKA